MARELYTRLGRPSTALLLVCFCLLATAGWKAILGADNGIDAGERSLAVSAGAPFEMAGSAAPIASAAGVVAALRSRADSPTYLDPPATLPILPGAGWRYFKGITSAPPSAWNTVGFDDTTWLAGPSGFGYGDSDDATVLNDMQNPPNTPGYVSVYIRREFDIPDLASIAGVRLTIDYDDAYVAHVNGAEVARSANMGGTVGTPPAYNTTASSNHEASAGSGGQPPDVVSIPSSALVLGTNVIAIQGHNGTLTSTDFSLIPRLEIELPPNAPPDSPSNPSPADLATGLSTNPELCVTVDDAEEPFLDVTFYGREMTGIAGDPFTIIALPDTQYYSATYPATYAAQTTWIRDNRVARNIAFATELGDCTDQGGIQAQWDNANAALSILEDPLTTLLPDGIPFGVAVGNHDQSPNGLAASGGDENITTTLYNQTLGKTRFSGRGYFGGNYPLPGFADSMDNHYELFTAGGMDFIAFHLEWDNTTCSWPSDGSAPTGTLTTCQNVLSWVRNTLSGTHANRRAMITTHFFGTPTSGGTGTPPFSTQGQAIFNAIKTLPNVFLLLGGHLDQADHRTDLATDGHEIHTVISDFQSRPNGGNGWLRIMTFDPQADTIHIETYSPTVGRYINKLNDGTPASHADNVAPTENEITLGYDMDAGLPFTAIGTDTGTPAGSQACMNWPGRQVNTTYEWYAIATDGISSTAGSRQSFTTTTTCTTHAECDDTDPCTDDTCNASQLCEHAAVANCCHTAADCDDTNVCTDDACTLNSCVITNNNLSCSDGDACTVGDFCSAGNCAAGSTATCDDANLCTTDSCIAPTGCANAFTPTAGCCSSAADCDDGNPGTTDSCAGGDCQNLANPTCNTASECDDGSVCTTDVCNGANNSALLLDGVDDYVTMGSVPGASGLGAAEFTLEAWIKWNGGGATASSGTGGITAVPVIAKGVGESEGATLNANYFFGIVSGTSVLGADFEEHSTGTTIGLNHPVTGTTRVTTGVWHHVAVTYGGGCWQLYLDGSPDTAGTTCPNQPPDYDSIQHFAIGAALNSTGVRTGAFPGRIDEVRVWSRVLSPAEILAGRDQEVTSGTGLIGRWDLDENTGTTASDSAATAQNGTLTGGPVWSPSDKAAIGPGTCEHTSVSCDDGNVCTTDTCDAINGCAYAAGNEGGACDDADACTTSDVCSGGACAGTPTGLCCNTDLDCSDGNTCTTDNCLVPNVAAVSFDGADDYLDYGDPALHPELALTQFTIETWLKKTGAGIQTGYWSGGSTAVPLVTKGRGVGDGGTQDLNYFLGIDASGTLTFSFEQSNGTLGADNRVAGTTVIQNGIWYHAAVTFDGANLRLYVGTEAQASDTQEGVLATTNTPQSASVHRFAIGSSYNDWTGATLGPAGYFQGVMDEVRVWNLARSAAEINADRKSQVLNGTGLVGRWGMDEGAGPTAEDSASGNTGTLTAGAAWTVTGLVDFGSGTCENTPATGASCDDGNLCLTGDTCDASGVCQPGSTPLSCDDGNVCTDDTCDDEQGCVNSINVAPCSDGNACTTGDICDGGTCAGGSTLFCDDGDTCTTDACNPATGCDFSSLACDDGNACTDDSCNAGTGCIFTHDDTNTCTDGDLCTGAETCSAGACVSGTPLVCDDADPCNGTEICYPVTGCGGGTPLDCDDLNPCTLDYCGPAGCVHEANPATCDDGDSCSTDSCGFVPSMSALAFDGVNDFVTMGAAPGLGVSRYTIETWFRRTGPGIGNSTGSGGIASLVPLIAKGAPQADGSNLDADYILGINTAGNVLAADFEDMATGLNHPISGTTPIANDTWYHAAATYDGTTWRLYLDGNLEATLVVGAFTPRSDSIQHAGLGAMLTSTGARLGAFQGIMDEARVWNHARSQAEILSGRNRRIGSDVGLVGRWGLDELLGGSAADSTTPDEDGALTNFDFTPASGWVAGAPALSTAECSYPNAPDGTSCTDGNMCTTPDQCTTGVCGGSAVPGCCLTAADCNDGDACTTDTCAGNVCEYTGIPGCTACTTDAQCDDANSCTADVCDTANDAAADLRLTTDYVNLGQDTTPNNFINNFGTNSFTIEGWFYANGFTTDLTSLFRAGRQGAFNQVVIQLRTGPYISGSVEGSPGGQVDTPNTAAAVTLNQWHHVAMVVDRTLTTPQVRVYLNGNLAGSVNTPWTAATVINMPAGDATLLGATRDSAGGLINNYNGRLDEWRIWNHARTPAEIQAGRTREIVSAAGLVHRWGFNEAGGSAIDDPGTYDGVMTGGATRITTSMPLFGNDTCVYTAANDGSTCDDLDACTVSTTCGAGVCGGGTPQTCDDSDLCTTDTCDSGTGCGHTLVVCSPGDTCSPTTGLCEPACVPTGTDEDCDNIDQDCDGTADDGYVSTPTSCGQGVCAATGATICTAGVTGDTCAIGTPTGPDDDCDNIDQDCDGAADDGYVSTPTSCGQGVCAATGATTCTAGVTGDTCAIGTPTVEICNGLDDDCNGLTDENVCAADIGGTLTYYRDAGTSLEPSTRGVSGVDVALTGTGPGVPDAVTTGSTGAYAFPGKPLNESYTVRPGRNGNFSGAITSFDAALVARKVVGLISLTPNQQLAADTTGNGDHSSFDAAQIARIAAGLDAATPVGSTVGSDWFMVPVPAPTSNQTVTPPAIPPGTNGSITYSPLVAAAAGQDFLTGLFGDVSGNWSNIAPMALRTGDGIAAIQALAAAGGNPAARLSVSQAVAVEEGTVQIAIRAEGAARALSFDLDLRYDAALLTPERVGTGSAAGRFTITPNTGTPGHVRISLFGAEALGASGELVVLTFRVRPGARGGSRLTLTGFVDEGSVPLSIRNGGVRFRKQR